MLFRLFGNELAVFCNLWQAIKNYTDLPVGISGYTHPWVFHGPCRVISITSFHFPGDNTAPHASLGIAWQVIWQVVEEELTSYNIKNNNKIESNKSYISKASAMCHSIRDFLYILILSSYNEIGIFHILHMTKLRLSNLFKVTQFPNTSTGVALKLVQFPLCSPLLTGTW